MVYGFFNHLDKMRRYGGFTRKELQWIGLSILVMTLLVGFDDGRDAFVLSLWLTNLLYSLIGVVIAVFVHEWMHRYWALEAGFRLEFKPFFYGLIAGLIISFMSYGKLVFLAYSGFRLHTLEKHRLGYFRYHLGYFNFGKIAASGPIANILVALIVSTMRFLPDGLTQQIVLVNVLFAITNMLPVPPLDGAHLMYASRLVYLWVFGAIVTIGLLLLYTQISVLYTLLAAIAGAVITAMIYFRQIERRIPDFK